MLDLDTLLNENQKAAVEYSDGPSIIVAGAGSGKTRVLTYKIAYLLEKGLPAGSILALTFTNKAAREMKSRIADVVGEERSRWLWMGTFHSIFSRILRNEAREIGYTPQFTVYDSPDSKSLIKSIVKEMMLDDKVYKANTIQSRISRCKNGLISPEAYALRGDLYQADQYNKIPKFQEIYAIYSQRCFDSNVMDFDDLLVNTHKLFKQHPNILEKYQNRFAYILVDEYQDTNTVQHAILLQLASKFQRVCVVGDDAQSIYSFRGANIDNMLTFQQSFPNCKLFKLEQNYRSTQTIVNAANSLIEKNKRQIRKTVYSKLEIGNLINVLSSYTDYDEAYAIANDVKSLANIHGVQYEDMAVLYRTNAQSRVLEEAFRKSQLPYKIYGSLSFYQRKEIKDVLAYLRLIINPKDEESLKRIINYPKRGIGDTTQNKVLEAAHQLHKAPLEIMQSPLDNGLNINSGTAGKLAKFAEMMQGFIDANKQMDAYDIVQRVIFDSGIMTDITSDQSPENISKKENIDEFINAVHEFCDKKVNNGEDDIRLVDFLSEVALLTDQDTDKPENKNSVTLMTVHAAKGLEFDYVYVVGLEENLFPSMMTETERELEEERRLFYVAITRAKKACTVSYAKSRFRNGQTQFSDPSRFLFDIDEKYLQIPLEMKLKNASPDEDPFADIFHKPESSYNERTSVFKQNTQKERIYAVPPQRKLTSMRQINNASNAPTGPLPFNIGDSVRHATFGDGVILSFDGEGSGIKAKIEFENHGIKQLLLKFARLEKI